jgi:dinuclear metal center YbgI/SA1388 family protein
MSGVPCPLVHRVIACMKRFAPLELADTTWDNVGLLVESPVPIGSHSNYSAHAPYHVMLTIDLTMDVVQECIEKHVKTVISYHPVLFQPLKSLCLSDPISKVLLHCIANGISVYSPHTSLDACVDGMNDWIAYGISNDPVEHISCLPIQPTPNMQSPATGMGRILKLKNPLPLSVVIKKLHNLFGVSASRICAKSSVNSDTKLISNVAICAGSGGSLFSKVQDPIDLFVTGEMTHHQILATLASKSDPIICLFEHTNTERGYLSKVLQPRLQELLSLSIENEDLSFNVMSSTRDKCPISIMATPI